MKFVLTSDLHYGFKTGVERKIQKMAQKIEAIQPEALIIAGDIATAAQHQFKRCMETLRSELSCDILYVRGNHDLWDGVHKKDKLSNTRSLPEIYRHHKEICDGLNIHHLDDGPFTYGDNEVEIFGFDGWYATFEPYTNDKYWMPKYHEGCPVPSYLVGKAWKDFGTCLDKAKKSKAAVKILVTHHNIYDEPKYSGSPHAGILPLGEEAKYHFNVLCCGHTHVRQNFMKDDMLVLNPGSDYADPKFMVIEVEDGRAEEKKS